MSRNESALEIDRYVDMDMDMDHAIYKHPPRLCLSSAADRHLSEGIGSEETIPCPNSTCAHATPCTETLQTPSERAVVHSWAM